MPAAESSRTLTVTSAVDPCDRAHHGARPVKAIGQDAHLCQLQRGIDLRANMAEPVDERRRQIAGKPHRQHHGKNVPDGGGMINGGQPFSPEVGREPREVAHHADDLMPADLRRIRLLVAKQQTERIRLLQIHLDEAAIDNDVRGAEVGGSEGPTRQHLHAIGLEEIDTDPRRVRKQRIRDADVRHVFRPRAAPARRPGSEST